ncbi:MAG: type II toxin-antitoxin system Phd/YefM family antitoxin [Treponemataceae bacterium]
MQTISVSDLKSHLSAELKKVERGERITVLDHKRPVAVLGPIGVESLFVREAAAPYGCPELAPLIASDPLLFLADERGDR